MIKRHRRMSRKCKEETRETRKTLKNPFHIQLRESM